MVPIAIGIAFGETFIEEHKNSHNAPYKYNGKELDEESGLYYYGARYYDSRLNLMISVDQLTEKFAGRSPYEYCFSNPVNLTDPTGMGPEDPPTNSKQVNSEIDKIKAKSPNAPIYLLVQSDTGEGRDREIAQNAGNLSYDLHTIQDQSNNRDTDYSNGSFVITVRHGENLITGGLIDTYHIDEINASFKLDFVGTDSVGGADNLDAKSLLKLPSIVSILNNNNQSISISSNTILGTNDPINADTQKGNGLMNGTVGNYNMKQFGNKRINVAMNALIKAGGDKTKISSGTPNVFNSIDPARSDGTFINFRFSNSLFLNATNRGSGPVNINKGKLQIF